MAADDLRDEFMAQFLETAEERLGNCMELLGRTGGSAERVEMVRARAEILRELHAFKGEARMMGSEEVGGATEVGERYLKERSVPIGETERKLLQRSFEAIVRYVSWEAGKVERSPKAELNALLRLLNRPPEAAESSEIDKDRTTRVRPGQIDVDTKPAPARDDETWTADEFRLRERRARVGIILLDDSEIVREMVVGRLKSVGYPTRGVSDLHGLLENCASQRPQLVLCDYQLGGGLTGTDVCRELASVVDTAGIPVVLFSGMEEAELAALAESSGAAGYLPKPDDLDDFVVRLDRMTDRFTRFD